MLINRLYELLAGLLPVPRIQQIARRRTVKSAGFEVLEDRVVPAVNIWTGAVSGLWSVDANWQDNSAPVSGDDLIFPEDALNKISVFDSGLGVSAFGSIDIQGGGYDISSSFASSLTLTSGITASYSNTVSTFSISFDPGNGSISVQPGAVLTLDGAISGTNGLTVSGGGTLQLSGSSSNTYSGTTDVSTGTTLVLNKSNTLAVPENLSIGSTGKVRLEQSNQIADFSAVSLGASASLELNGYDDAIGTLALTGASVTTGAGKLTLGGDLTTNASSSTSTISGKLDLGGATRSFIVADGAAGTDLTISAVISGTGAGITKAGGSSAMALSGNNTYDGTTTINTGGIIISHANALGATSAGTIVNPGALIGYQGSITFAAEPLTISGNGVGNLGAVWSSSGSNTVTSPITLAASSYIGAESAAPLTITGQITDGSSSFGLTKVRSGNVTLSGANSYDGGTTVSAGTLSVGNDSALGTGAAVVNNSTSLRLTGGVTVANNVTISGTGVSSGGALGNTSGDNTLSGNVTLAANSSIGSTSGTLTISGPISDDVNSYGVSKVGAGRVILSGSSDYNGATTISAGILQVDGSLPSSIDLQGGTLSGTGTISGSGFSGTGGTVDPGVAGAPGILTYGNSAGLTLPSSSTFHVDLDGTTVGTGYDRLVLSNGSAIFDPNGANLEVDFGYLPTVGTSFQIVSQTVGLPITGRFNGISQFGSVTTGAVTFSVGYFTSGVVLTVTNVTPPTYTWTGLGADNNWSTAANWDKNQAPSGGEKLVFPSGAPRSTNYNDLSGKSFDSIAIGGSGYTLSGNGIILTGGISASYTAGTSFVGLNLTLTSTETVDVAEGGTLDLSGTIGVDSFAGNYGVMKNGSGTLRYSGSTANLYNGATIINAGTLVLAKSDDVIAANGTIIVGDNSSGAKLVVEANNQFWVGSDITVNEGSSFEAGSHVTHISNLNLRGATVQIDANGVLDTFIGVTSYTTFSNVTSTIQGLGALGIDNSQNFITVADDLDLAVDLRISVSIQGTYSSSGIYKVGSGTLALAGNNSFGGSFNVGNGIVQVENSAAFGTTTGGTTISDGASVFFTGIGLEVAEPFVEVSGNGYDGQNAFRVISGDTTLGGTVSLSGFTTVGAVSGASLTFNGEIDDISGDYGLYVVNGADGRTILGASNLFDGQVIVSSGYIRATSEGAFGNPETSADVTIESGATLELSGDIAIPSTKTIGIAGVPVANSSKIVNVSGNNIIHGNVVITGGNNVGLDVASGTQLTVTGTISGARDVDKNGPGTLLLSNSNQQTGNVNVGEGKLLVTGSLALSNSVFVDGVLGGTGTVAPTTVSSIGTLSPGITTGILNSGDLTFTDSGSIYHVELNGPVAGTGYDQTVVAGTVTLAGASLNVSLGYVPAGGTGFVIIKNDGFGAINGTFNQLPEGASFTVSGQVFRITYVGGDGNDVVLYANNAPTAIQLGSSTVSEGAAIGTVVGSFTTSDLDIDDTFTYTLVSGDGDINNSAFEIDSSGRLVTKLIFDYEAQTTYSVRVRSTDSGGLFTEQDFTINVLPVNDNSPVFTSPAAYNVAENTTAVGTVAATDADLPAQTVTYSITGGADAALFTIDPDTGVLTFRTAPDFELPGDVGENNVYKVNVTANDNAGLTTVQCLTITVTEVNDNSPVFTSPASYNVAENTTAVGTVAATDADLPAQTVTYSITGGADAALFTIDPDTGVLTFRTAPDFELPGDVGENNVYKVNVTANDNAGLTTVQCLTITVTDVNDNSPVFSSPASYNVAENTTAVGTVAATDADLPAQTVTYSITGGADAALFTIDPDTGVLTFRTAPDFELPGDVGENNVYKVNVTANDNAGRTTVQCLTITVTEVNDNSPVFTSPAAYNVAENTTAVGTVVATDADLPAQTVTYSITGGADAALFTIDPDTGVLTFRTAPDFELPGDVGENNVYKVNVTANDNAGLITVQCLTITVTDVNDNSPVFTSPASYNVAENTTAVGTVAATDADLPAQTVTYSITGGADAALFTIDPDTGVLTFRTAPDFELPGDAGENNVYKVNVTANDNAGLTTVQCLTITVTDVNDNSPVFTSPASYNVAENTTAVGTVAATDADLPAQTVTYSITGGADAALFTIDPDTGVLTFRTAPDFELPGDAGENNVYKVNVTANDNAGLTTVHCLTITVTDVNDNSPVFTSPATYSVSENTSVVGTVAATDADLPQQQITYSITGGVDQALFSIDPTTGVLSFLTPPDFEHPTDVGANNTYEVQVTANDGAGSTTVQDLTVSFTNLVENPVISLNPEDGTYWLGKENAAVDPTAHYQSDVTTSDYSQALLTVSISANRQRKDTLGIQAQGDKPGQINLRGKKILFGGVVIGTFKGGTRANPTLEITFNSDASDAAVQALVKRITFFSPKDRRASQAPRTVQMRLTNVSGLDSNHATRIINIVDADR